MGVMEGPLSKWTNVMNGWQYRWFVLDSTSGILSYYTSKEKMVRGSRQGCVRLKTAIIGIDDEDDSTFTITVDHKTFHFQARDSEERERWMEALEKAIEWQALSSKKFCKRELINHELFQRKLAETDAYLQILIEQNNSLQRRIAEYSDVATKESYSVISVTVDAMIEAIKHAIVMLQISKESLKEPILNGSLLDFSTPALANSNEKHVHSVGLGTVEETLGVDRADKMALETDAVGLAIPCISYSSSDDDEFFDAVAARTSPPPPQRDSVAELTSADNVKVMSEIIIAPGDEFDDLYDIQDDEDLGSVEQHGTVIGHLISQVRIGMDLTKVVLPTFILERRSLLEMYADFFAHPDFFCKVADMLTPRDRIIQIAQWYLSAFHAGRPSDIAKKPYNPVLGETFRCHWNLLSSPSSDELNSDGPLPWTRKSDLCFIAEQVSHHPPISAFYAECANKKVAIDGYLWTKSKFLGLSIGVHMVGQAVISLIDHNEEYIVTFPNGYGRSILTIPWVELGGKAQVACPQTGYSATVQFHTKPFYGGKKNRVSANIFDPGDKKPFMSIEGEWNGAMYVKHGSWTQDMFLDTKSMPIHKKRVQPLDHQGDFESRKLWKDVTKYLKLKDIDRATHHKQRLEQQQREDANRRKVNGVKWETKNFHEEGEHWVYDNPLQKRLL